MEMERIGYWEGMPRRSMTLIGHTIKGFFLSRSIVLNVLFLLIVPGMAFFTLVQGPGGVEEYMWWLTFIEFGNFFYLQIFVLIYCVLYGASMLNSEFEDRTMTYLIVRGSRRFEILIWKYIGTLISLWTVFLLSELITYTIMAMHGPAGSFSEHLSIFLALVLATMIGIALYLSLFTLIGLLFKHPLMISLFYAFLWEIVVVNIPYNVRRISVMHYLRSVFTLDNTVKVHLELEGITGVNFSVVFLVVLTILFLLAGSAAITRKDVL
ncbi:MAG: ABC transporter permease subunit [Thermoplasmatota archaeon]